MKAAKRQASKRRSEIASAMIFALFTVSVFILAACGGPATTPTPSPLPPLPASPTANPLVPTTDPDESLGVNEPTAASVASGGDVGSMPFPAEEPFEAAADDGLRLRGTLYRASVEPAPAVLLLHMLDGRSGDWLPLITPLQQAGYTVLAMDLRGHGSTRGTQDWNLARQDVAVLLAALCAVDGVDANRVGVVGASIGANLALTGCAADALCRTAVLLSPGLDYRGVTTAGPMAALGERPVLIVASSEDRESADSSRTLDGLAQGEHRLVMYDGAGHGTRMFGPQPGLIQTILDWLGAHL